jgi:Tol biopolymer transport system component
MRDTRFFPLVVLVLLIGVTLIMAGRGVASPGTTTRVSVSTAGNQGNNDSPYHPAISADGRYVAFESYASNLTVDLGNPNSAHIFLHDRQTGATTMVSVGAGDPSSVSADGRFVAFDSSASNLVGTDTDGDGTCDTGCDTNDADDVFVHDRLTGTTERVSVDSSGGEANGSSYDSAVSADWRYVVFNSFASNLVSGDSNNTGDIFVHDRETGTTTRVSVDSAGNQAEASEDGGGSYRPAISADGRYVAFDSIASNLVPGDLGGLDVFVHDRQTGATTRVSVDSAGGQAHGWSEAPAISADGRYVAFESDAFNLVLGDTNGADDVFVHDRLTGTTERVSVDSAGNQTGGGGDITAISADGRYVAFQSGASDLVPADTNGRDVFVHDRQTGVTTRVSVDSAGNQSNGTSWVPAISADGRYVAFVSDASNLVPGDTNGFWDVFVHDRGLGAVGGIVGLRPNRTVLSDHESDSASPAYIALAGAAAAAAITLTAGGWYARRRWGR